MAETIDYRAELKATLGEFEKAAAKGNEAARALYSGVNRLAKLTQAALQGTPFEDQADLLAAQLAKAGVTVETLHNAPLKVTRTGGADIYKVVKTLQKAAQEKPARPAPEITKPESGRK